MELREIIRNAVLENLDNIVDDVMTAIGEHFEIDEETDDDSLNEIKQILTNADCPWLYVFIDNLSYQIVSISSNKEKEDYDVEYKPMNAIHNLTDVISLSEIVEMADWSIHDELFSDNEYPSLDEIKSPKLGNAIGYKFSNNIKNRAKNEIKRYFK